MTLMKKWRCIGALLALLTSGCGSVTEFRLEIGLQAPPIIADYLPRLGLELEISQELPSYEITPFTLDE